MNFQAITTLLVLIAVIVVLTIRRRSPDVTLLSAVMVPLIVPIWHESHWQFGVISSKIALSDFANLRCNNNRSTIYCCCVVKGNWSTTNVVASSIGFH